MAKIAYDNGISQLIPANNLRAVFTDDKAGKIVRVPIACFALMYDGTVSALVCNVDSMELVPIAQVAEAYTFRGYEQVT